LICIDTREHEWEFIEMRLQALGVDTAVTCLEHGVDYLIMGTRDTVSVQRKTFPEICTQMQDIREDVIPAMMDASPDSSVLLVEEYFTIDNKGMMWRKEGNFMKPANISARMYYNFLQSIRLMGCDVVVTKNLEHSIWWMNAIHTYVHNEHYPKQKKRYGANMQAVGALCAVNSFGITASKKVLEKHTISELIHLKDSELGKIMTINQIVNFRRVFGDAPKPAKH
jgi:hypothetical protein